jgi:hypothetical protein
MVFPKPKALLPFYTFSLHLVYALLKTHNKNLVNSLFMNYCRINGYYRFTSHLPTLEGNYALPPDKRSFTTSNNFSGINLEKHEDLHNGGKDNIQANTATSS